MWKYGTSQATPAVSGAAAVIRQYFTEGYYYSGDLGSGPNAALYGFTPSGALMKAMLIAAAQPLSDIFQSLNMDGDYGATHDVPYSITNNGQVPSYDQGYGRVQLNRVLHNGAASLSPISLFVIGNVDSNGSHYAQLNNTGQTLTYSFTTGANPSPIKIVLTYTTPVPQSFSAASDAILNELTLSSSGQQTLAQSAGFPYSHAVDPVSVIIISNPLQFQSYSVTVTAKYLGDTHPQPFALVIVGNIVEFSSPGISETYAVSEKSLQNAPFYSAFVVMAVFSIIILAINIPLWFFYYKNNPPKSYIFRLILQIKAKE